jgi:hypothetical protein
MSASLTLVGFGLNQCLELTVGPRKSPVTVAAPHPPTMQPARASHGQQNDGGTRGMRVRFGEISGNSDSADEYVWTVSLRAQLNLNPYPVRPRRHSTPPALTWRTG